MQNIPKIGGKANPRVIHVVMVTKMRKIGVVLPTPSPRPPRMPGPVPGPVLCSCVVVATDPIVATLCTRLHLAVVVCT